MTRRTFTHHCALAAILGLASASAFGTDDKRAPGIGATPPPKKKAEHEADEPEAPEPDSPAPKEESFYVVQVLLGLWRTRAEDGPRQLAIKERGQYVLSARQTDTGFLKAQLGRYLRRPDRTKKWEEGTYKLRSIDVLETDGSLGKLVWERVK